MHVRIHSTVLQYTGEQSKLFHSDKVPKSFFTNVLNELVSRSDCEPRHLHYLVCTMWSLKEFSAAKVSLKRVLSEIGVTELATVQRLMELGKQILHILSRVVISHLSSCRNAS